MFVSVSEEMGAHAVFVYAGSTQEAVLRCLCQVKLARAEPKPSILTNNKHPI